MRPGRVRHYVIAARDLEAVCGEIYEYLELEPAPQEHREDGSQVTEQYGFRTHMMRIGTTMLEVVSPIRERHELQKFFVEQGGDGGFMVVMQTYDDDALLARAKDAGLALRFEIPDFLGQHLMQFDYEVLGTRFEHYLYTPEDNWWGDPLNWPLQRPVRGRRHRGCERRGGRSRIDRRAHVDGVPRHPRRATRCSSSIAASSSWRRWRASGASTRCTSRLATAHGSGESKRIANVDFRLV